MKKIEALKNEFNRLAFDHQIKSIDFPLNYPKIYKSIKKDYDKLNDFRGRRNLLLKDEAILEFKNILVSSNTLLPKEVLVYFKDILKNKYQYYNSCIKDKNNIKLD